MTKTETKKDRWMICKVQVSISGKPGTLIYNKDRSFTHMYERSFGKKLLGKGLKGYFKMCHRADGVLETFERKEGW